jgi:outer membrane receptor protein involved in Fe transport
MADAASDGTLGRGGRPRRPAACGALRVAGTAAAVALTQSLPAWADADLEGLLDQSVVSTASESAEAGSVAPATVSVVTAEDLQRYGIHTLNEAINYLSLGMVTSQPLHSVELGARGVLLTGDYGNHVLVLVDGHALNEPWGGTSYVDRGLGIPIEAIDHVELVLGPGSVLYGSNAMLGVINVITKRAKDYRGVHVSVDSEVPVTYRGAAAVGLPWAGRTPGEVLVAAELYRQDGPAFSFGPQEWGADAVTGEPKRFSATGEPTGVWGGTASNAYYARASSAFARFSLGDLEVRGRVSQYKRASPYLDSLINSTGTFDDPNNFEQDRWGFLDVRYHAVLSPELSVQLRAYGDAYSYQWVNESVATEDCPDGMLGGCSRDLRGWSRWAGLELTPTFDWTRDGRYPTLLGVDARLQNVESRTIVTDLATGAPTDPVFPHQASQRILGLYAQQIARPARWLTLNVGARADLVQRVGSDLSPRAAVVFEGWRGGTLKVVYAEAFRAPTAYEMDYADPGFLIPAPDLKPEKVRSVEASLEQRMGSQRLLFGVFRTWWNQLVFGQTLSADELAAAQASGQISEQAASATQYRNASAIENYGFNTAYEGSALARRLRYGINFTGTYTRIRYPFDPLTGEPGEVALPLTVGPQWFGNARTSFDLGAPLPTLALAVQFQGRRAIDRAFDGGFAPPITVEPHWQLRATASGPVPGIRGLSYRLSADRTFDRSSPYVIGPNLYASAAQPVAELAPLDRLRASIGLTYEILP